MPRFPTTRFGPVDVATDDAVDFPEGLIGADGGRFALLADDPSAPFVWLQSLDDPELAVPVTDPGRFFPAYAVELADAERDGLDAQAVFVMVRPAEALGDFSANLRAPILIAGGRGRQVVNQAADAPVRAPLFPAA